MANRHESLYLFIFFIAVIFFIFFLVSKKRKKLAEYLSKHGVECEGEAKLIGYAGLQGTIIKISFQLNGQTIIKTMVHDEFNLFSQDPAIGQIRKLSILVDPLNTDRYIFK